MTKAIQAGIPKTRIEEAAARTQARIDSGQQTVIGVNKYRPATEENINVLHVDNTAVLEAQIANLKRLAQIEIKPRLTQPYQPSPKLLAARPATYSSWPLSPRRLKPLSEKLASRWKKFTVATKLLCNQCMGSMPPKSGMMVTCRKFAGSSNNSTMRKVAGHESWSPKWVRTDTTAVKK